jgi:hypothetical protein
MSTETQEPAQMGTKPVKEHEWLGNLVGNWRTVAVMSMGPDQPDHTANGTENVKSVGGLWAYSEGKGEGMGDETMEYYSAIGYDVSFNEYRGFWFGSMSSHVWKYTGELSADKKKLTLNCTGPHMVKDGETANYRDVHELVDENNRTMTSFAEDDDGNWNQFMRVTYTRV